MKIETALNHRDRAITAIADLYANARISGMHSDQVIKDYLGIIKTINHCPMWVTTYCEGYQKAKMQELYKHYLVHGGFINDVFYSTDSSRSDYYGKVINPCEWHNMSKGKGFYWVTTETTRLFYIIQGEQSNG